MRDDNILKVVNNWHKIDTENDYYANAEMLAWALKNCQFKFYNRGSKFFFADHKDATMFALKYASYFGTQEQLTTTTV
jgi:hypothetical protein